MNVYEILKQRGFIARTTEDGEKKFQVSDEGAIVKLFDQKTTVYQGFDPSADSLHLGHFMGVMALHHIQEAGNKVIFILGGATGRIGDPSGKITARVLLSEEQVKENGRALRKQVEDIGLLKFGDPKKAEMIDNATFIQNKMFLDEYMMEIARHFSVSEMIKMETFARKLKENKPLSLLEFLYTTVQAWDFLILYEENDCKIQVGGSDQWGNILQGIDLIKSHHGKKANAQGITFKLLTTPDGQKMGKTEAGPLWLDPKKTTPFDFYQYLEKIDDSMVRDLFGIYTFLPMEEIDEIVSGNPREAQKRLAFEVTKVVHGEKEAEKARDSSKVVFATSIDKDRDLSSIPEFKTEKGTLLDVILSESGSLKGKTEVRRRCEGGAIRVDDKKIEDPKMKVNTSCVIRYGKSKFLNVQIS